MDTSLLVNSLLVNILLQKVHIHFLKVLNHRLGAVNLFDRKRKRKLFIVSLMVKDIYEVRRSISLGEQDILLNNF